MDLILTALILAAIVLWPIMNVLMTGAAILYARWSRRADEYASSLR
jgi:hypothetical protein